MRNSVQSLVDSGQLVIVESIQVPPRAERRLAVPAAYLQGAIGEWLKRSPFATDGTLWRHQSLALEAIDGGSNVVLATGTASGKSLVFQLAVIREIMEGGGKALVLYPLKALLSDQFARWKEIANAFGLPSDAVAEMHGDVVSDDRMEAVRNARIIVATPDVVQAWFMRQVSAPAFRALLCDLRYCILDEAHVYESVFGSNVAYLMRRLLAARKRACQERGEKRRLQIVAATATIADPIDHMFRLTGWQFEGIGEEEDGAPHHGRLLHHIEGPDTGHPGEAMLQDLIQLMLDGAKSGSFLAFHDSRQGVERVARSVDLEDVLPYRSGYEADDRKKIERALKSGHLRGVVSTSALELGIDIAHFSVGLNLGVPGSKKAFRQRIGRVGRQSPGTFAVIAPRHAFTRYGANFREYYEGSVEPSHLYVSNRFIQFAQARCLIDESESLGTATNEPPPGVTWPDSFRQTYEFAKPGARRPREFDYIAQLGADSPHYNYPLRQVGEANYKLVEGEQKIGDIALNQAIREAYPGALHLHLRRPTKVVEWRSNSFDRSIRLVGARNQAPTRPILRKTVNISFDTEDVVCGRIMSGPTGVLAEINVQVNESVEGYTMGGKSLLYRDLRAQNPKMTRKQREFRSTGMVLKIEEPWFAGNGQPAMVRQAVAEALKQLLLREKSISPNDVDSAHSNIAFYVSGAPRRATDTVVVYDSIYGGLRLTEPLFVEFDDFLRRLQIAAQRAGAEAFLAGDVTDHLRKWFDSLRRGAAQPDRALVAPEGEYIVYAPGSEVAVLHQGVLSERVLIEPRLFTLGDTTMLMYRYETGGRGEGWVPHDQIQTPGQEWRLAIWDPVTGAIRDPQESEEGVF